MKPIDVHIHTNTQCNLKCIHCYENVVDEQKLCLDDRFEVALIQYLCNNYEADIHLEGGEIFLEEHLLQALAALNEDARKRITVTSNGTIFTDNPKTLDVLRTLCRLRISVEGHTEEIQYKIRGCGLHKVLQNALHYQQEGVSVVLRLTLNALNVDTLFSETLPFFINKGFNQFQIYEMQPVGRGEKSGLCITAALDNLFNDWVKHPLDASVTVSLPQARKREVEANLNVLEKFGIYVKNVDFAPSINISAAGEVRVCAWDMLSSPATVITETTIENLEKFIASQTKAHKCDHCTRFVLHGGV